MDYQLSLWFCWTLPALCISTLQTKGEVTPIFYWNRYQGLILIRSAGASASGANGAGTSIGIGSIIGIGTTIGIRSISVLRESILSWNSREWEKCDQNNEEGDKTDTDGARITSPLFQTSLGYSVFRKILVL